MTTIRRLESGSGEYAVSEATAEGVQMALQDAGVEFIHDGVCIKRTPEDANALYESLLAIAQESARQLEGQPPFSEADLYGDDGLPA